MIIVEKALVKAMQNAAKTGGYRIQWSDDGQMVTICCSQWLVQIERNRLPRKVLAKIAEHFGELPETGTFSVTQRKHEDAQIQGFQHDVFAADVVHLVNGQAQHGFFTGLTAWGAYLYKSESGKLYAVNPDELELAPNLPFTIIEEKSLRWIDDESALFIYAQTKESMSGVYQEVINRLELIDFQAAAEAAAGKAEEKQADSDEDDGSGDDEPEELDGQEEME